MFLQDFNNFIFLKLLLFRGIETYSDAYQYQYQYLYIYNLMLYVSTVIFSPPVIQLYYIVYSIIYSFDNSL